MGFWNFSLLVWRDSFAKIRIQAEKARDLGHTNQSGALPLFPRLRRMVVYYIIGGIWKKWRRGESNPRPKVFNARRLHACFVI